MAGRRTAVLVEKCIGEGEKVAVLFLERFDFRLCKDRVWRSIPVANGHIGNRMVPCAVYPHGIGDIVQRLYQSLRLVFYKTD